MNNQDKLREKMGKIKKKAEADKKQQDEEKSLALDDLKSMTGVGMRKVDPLDIRPPRVFLVQNIKDKSELKDDDGKECPDGQFFNDGNNEIFEKLDCYFLYAEKGIHTNKRHLDWGDLPKYTAIGMKIDDGKLFTITFKNTSKYALSKLFTAVKVMGYPMFSFRCSLEVKLINGTDKEGQPTQWFISVVRVGEIETDKEKLGAAHKMAIALDSRSDIEFEDGDMEETPGETQLERDAEEALVDSEELR